MQINLIKRINSNNKNAKNILIIGVFHGDEEAGEYLIKRYLNETTHAYGPRNGKTHQNNNAYYIPRLNTAKTRVNKNGVDLNRNFPTSNWGELNQNSNDNKNSSKKSIILPVDNNNPDNYYEGPSPASEKETKFIVNLMDKINFDAIITLHSPYKVVNYDGDNGGKALKLAETISTITDYPVQKDIGYPTPGSFGTYAGVERDIPTITIEMADDIAPSKLYPKFKHLFEYLEYEY